MSIFDYYSDLFNEAEVLRADSKEPDIDEITISYKRKKKSGKREADLSDLPTRIFNHTLSEEELRENFLKVTMNSLQKYTSGVLAFKCSR